MVREEKSLVSVHQPQLLNDITDRLNIVAEIIAHPLLSEGIEVEEPFQQRTVDDTIWLVRLAALVAVRSPVVEA